MSKVFVLDTTMRQLNPVHSARARILLSKGQAAVYRRYPFTIVLKTQILAPIEPLRVKIDPGSKTTGMAIVNDATGEVVIALELSHRADKIKAALDDRRAIRRGRRHRKTRYRKPRWNNRRAKKKGWLAPSLESRISNIMTWVQRLMRACHLAAISMELVKFDMQLLEHPEISGVEYQQGTLQGYEVRAYLLEKWGRKCSYCGKENIRLQIEHIVPRSKLGTNRISNLCLACERCNIEKGSRDMKEFLKSKPDLFQKILAQAKAPLRDAAAVNTTRWKLFERLQSLGLPIECGSGGLTKYNRILRQLPKSHWADAVCIGKSTPERVLITGVHPLLIAAKGHGCRQVCNVNRFGFPHGKPKQAGRAYGFRTGDMVQAVVTSGKKIGTYTGRVLVRATGSFDIATPSGRVQGIHYRYCQALHRTDGYSYSESKAG